MAGHNDNKMKTPIFYSPPENITGDTAEIVGPEAHHALNVMRLGTGDTVIIVDGCGSGHWSEITRTSRGKISCNVFSHIRQFGEPAHNITLAAGMSKGTKFDDVIQKGTELGVCRFIPLLCEKSPVRIDEPGRLKTRRGRWRKVAIASMKQSRRSLIPEITDPMSVAKVFESVNNLGNVVYFDPAGDKTLASIPAMADVHDHTIFVGPESGFSIDETELASSRGANIISLGSRILRTENAAPVAVAVVMQNLGEFSY